MNKRIRELAADAGYPDYMTYGQDKVLEKFAELIIQECLFKANGAKIRGESIDELIQRIKEDFGVEE